VSPAPNPDTLGAWDEAAALPEQLVEALELSRTAAAKSPLAAYASRSVVAVGLGVAATACDAVATLTAGSLAVPLTVLRDAHLPDFVDGYTLVLAFSSTTADAETDAAARAALDRSAHVVRIGPKGSDDAPHGIVSPAGGSGVWWPAVSGATSGRSTLPGLVVPALVALDRLGFSREWEQDLLAASAALAARRDALIAPGGLPEELARHIGRTFPLVYGSSGIGAVAARWWKDEVNRNAKSPAFAAELPGLAYGELAGWGQSGDVTRQVLTLVELRHGGESRRTADLFAAVTAATDEVMAAVLEVEAVGDDDLTRFFDLALIGQLLSLLLAAQEGVDPGPTPAIDEAQASAAAP
jgi:glucose/mannose-6-phosphate isomerase